MSAVKGKPYKRVDPDELARLRRGKKMTHTELAAHFNVTPRTIARRLQELGLTNPDPRAGRRLGDEWKERAGKMLDDGASMAEVARTTGCGFQTVQRHFPGRGWSRTESGQFAHAVREANRALAMTGTKPLPSIMRRTA